MGRWWRVEGDAHVPKPTQGQPSFGAVHAPDMQLVGLDGSGNKIYTCNWPDCDLVEVRP